MTVFVGGVSELFQRDLDLGRLAVEQLRTEDLGAGVTVEDLHYGAVAVAQQLADEGPDLLVLVAATRRGRPPGTVQRRRIDPPHLSTEELQAAVGDAVVGYVHVDLVVDVAAGFGVLPPRTVAVEVEPEEVGPGEGLSASASAGLRTALTLVRDEVRRAPLLQLVGELRPLLDGDRLEDSDALRVLRALLDELEVLDRDGRWGAAFALCDRLRLAIAGGSASAGMDHRDWGLWWALIEGLDRLQAIEGASPASEGPPR
ncbi:hypothetical protein [Blastococcus mobilis]|uniref:Hydrogenase maturation protease n=1 Tax=Blastococcus mobilis TaxID=1938746 RepID=A0A238ZF11_9ACTN|nr:hypothetical protein [Blastococcus mobilis]SNR81870.1 hypothetical protein SAMN06272737_12824 [Blastococcus mobilis]